ncbi:hypothetical protein H8S90_10175 [Olivibacter sp. SDN3]|uniref:alpha-amylase family protein n=1 Tax=Olivibacter sp. SDN3 TaxID=2764720 RepID=UPI0016512278|nr:alpha-amylase family protein [Olivibacter sp. SDN3]QNL51905.1 hypothetical protein H8S90_10175 [Olivibacter sp. SDN3]
MINKTYLFTLRLLFSFIPCLVLAQEEDPSWWKRNNLRVIQTNLPDFTAKNIEPKAFVEQLVAASANTLIINAGGIMAFYPTSLPYHYRNPYAADHMLADIIDRCHQWDIRVIVRVDFSRLHKTVFEQYPDWCYLSADGQRMFNDDIYVVSINAPYVQEKSFEIINEIIGRYPVDGIFLNMPGYQTANAYKGQYYGIDHNPHDQARFKSFSGGLDLPKKEDGKDPVFRKYQAFKQMTLNKWAEKLHTLIKTKNPAIAICTYSDQYVDIIRHESQSNTSLPYWPYTASDNVSNAMGSYPEHIVSNASIQQVSFQSRFNSVGPEEVRIRLYENIANGSGLDVSMMGEFNHSADPRNFQVIRDVYRFHQQNEGYYGNYQSLAKILVLSPAAWAHGEAGEEYRGIQLMLKEAHIPFDVMERRRLNAQEDRLSQYEAIIVPGTPSFDSVDLKALSAATESGVSILATGPSFIQHRSFLKERFGASVVETDYDAAGNYLMIDDTTVFTKMDGQRQVFLNYTAGLYTFDSAVSTYLPILSKGRPGPPEIVGGHEPTDYKGLGVAGTNELKHALMPLSIGRLYYLKGYEQHKQLFLNTLTAIYPQAQDLIKTNAPEKLEIVFKQYAHNNAVNSSSGFQKNGHILHLINLTGFNGNTYFKPYDLSNIVIECSLKDEPSEIHLLKSSQQIDFTWKDGKLHFTIPKIVDYEAVVIKNKK